MKHKISSCVLAMAVVAAFHGDAAAQSLNYSDAVTVPQVDSKMNNGRDAAQPQSAAARSRSKGNVGNSPSPSAGVTCDEVSCVQNGIFPDSYNNAGYAAIAAAERFRNEECGFRREASYVIYEKGGDYYLGTKAWYIDETSARVSAPVGYDSRLMSEGYNPVAVVHDHPNSETSWFSTGDAKSAKVEGLDCYVYTCKGERRTVLGLDHNDGRVYEINPRSGERVGRGYLEPPSHLILKSKNVSNNDPYQGVLAYIGFPNVKKAAANGLSEMCRGTELCFEEAKCVIDTSKPETELPRSRANELSGDSDFDSCKCAVPDDRDFRCQKCGKISKWLAPHRDKEFEQMLKRK